jgi:translocator protein
MKTPLRHMLGLIGWLLLTFAAAAVGGLASMSAPAFYGQLELPPWAPPATVFGPVWTVLYLLIGIAAWLVWKARGWRGARMPLTLFLVQLALNALWTWLFFGWRLGALAFAEIVVLWVLILLTLIMFWRVRVLAGALLVPYLLWVSFATALTFSIWQRNPDMLAFDAASLRPCAPAAGEPRPDHPVATAAGTAALARCV